MKTYAWIVDGAVWQMLPPTTWQFEVLSPDGSVLHAIGDEVDISDKWPESYMPNTILVPDDLVDQVNQHWLYDYDTNTFSPPPGSLPPTAEEILANNQAVQASLITQASQAMAPVLVSLQLGDATDEETTTAKAWQAYYRALQSVDLTLASPQWPQAPQA